MPKLLLVEDNRAISTALGKYLKMKGFDIEQAFDGRTGLVSIEKGNYDAVLLDLAMPEFSGYDVIDELSSSNLMEKKKIIIYTASGFVHTSKDDLLKKGVKAIITKPAEPEFIIKTINEVLSN